MYRLLVAAIAAVFTIVFGSMAVAQAPSPPPVYSWTGFYVGGNIGVGWSGSGDVSYTANDPASLIMFNGILILPAGGQPPPTSLDGQGMLGGVQFGFNYQINAIWLIGFEADFNFASIDGRTDSSGVLLGAVPYTASVYQGITWFGTVRGRLGYLPMPRLLAYVTGGWAYGRAEYTGTYTNTGTGTPFTILAGSSSITCAAATVCYSGSASAEGTGWTVGGGLEYAILQNVTLKAEYLYVNLDLSNPIVETALIGSSSITANLAGRTALNIVRVGVNYQFPVPAAR